MSHQDAMVDDGFLLVGNEQPTELPPLPPRHQFSIKSAKFDVDARYSPLKLLGKGAYGVVWYHFSAYESRLYFLSAPRQIWSQIGRYCAVLAIV